MVALLRHTEETLHLNAGYKTCCTTAVAPAEASPASSRPELAAPAPAPAAGLASAGATAVVPVSYTHLTLPTKA